MKICIFNKIKYTKGYGYVNWTCTMTNKVKSATNNKKDYI